MRPLFLIAAIYTLGLISGALSFGAFLQEHYEDRIGVLHYNLERSTAQLNHLTAAFNKQKEDVDTILKANDMNYANAQKALKGWKECAAIMNKQNAMLSDVTHTQYWETTGVCNPGDICNAIADPIIGTPSSSCIIGTTCPSDIARTTNVVCTINPKEKKK